jgi:VanZ family protein
LRTTTGTNRTSTPRLVYAGLAASLLLFTVYVSLLPFRFQSVALDTAWRHFAAAMTTWPARLPRANFLANLLLFVPIGFGLAGARLADGPGRPVVPALVIALAASVVTSLMAEFLQAFAPGRVVSGADVVAQTTGCLLGLAIWTLVGQGLTRWIRQSRTRNRHDRLTRALAAYVGLWAFANLAPFDISINPGTLAARVRQGAIAFVPFARPMTPTAWWDAAVIVVSSLPLGMLAVSGWWTRETRRGAFVSTVIGVVGLTVIESAQIFIRSHVADTTDVVWGTVGVVGGVFVGARVWGRRRSSSRDTDGGAKQ